MVQQETLPVTQEQIDEIEKNIKQLAANLRAVGLDHFLVLHASPQIPEGTIATVCTTTRTSIDCPITSVALAGQDVVRMLLQEMDKAQRELAKTR